MGRATRFCQRDEKSVPREALPPHLGMQRKLLKTSCEASKRHRTEDTLGLWKEIIHFRKTWIYKTVWLWPFSSTPQKLPGQVCTQSGHSFNASDFSSGQNTRKKTRTEVTFVVSHDDLEVRNPGMRILSNSGIGKHQASNHHLVITCEGFNKESLIDWQRRHSISSS